MITAADAYKLSKQNDVNYLYEKIEQEAKKGLYQAIIHERISEYQINHLVSSGFIVNYKNNGFFVDITEILWSKEEDGSCKK